MGRGPTSPARRAMVAVVFGCGGVAPGVWVVAAVQRKNPR